MQLLLVFNRLPEQKTIISVIRAKKAKKRGFWDLEVAILGRCKKLKFLQVRYCMRHPMTPDMFVSDYNCGQYYLLKYFSQKNLTLSGPRGDCPHLRTFFDLK